MTQSPLDTMDIDEILSLKHEADHDRIWQALIEDPEASVLWDRELERRHRIEQVASVAMGRPTLARLFQLVVACRRWGARLPNLAIDLLPETPQAVGRLGPTESSRAEPLRLEWGQVLFRATQVGELVRLTCLDGDDGWTVRYVSGDASDALPTRAWRLEPGETPVALIVSRDAQDGSRVDGGADVVAVVVLVQPSEIRETTDV